jgi:hypothetical protein
MECSNCGRVWSDDRFNFECATPDWCFACRSKTVRTAFQGGKEYFHSDTEANRARKAVAEATRAGFDPVPYETGKAWNGGSAAGLKKIESVQAAKAAKAAAAKVGSV